MSEIREIGRLICPTPIVPIVAFHIHINPIVTSYMHITSIVTSYIHNYL